MSNSKQTKLAEPSNDQYISTLANYLVYSAPAIDHIGPKVPSRSGEVNELMCQSAYEGAKARALKAAHSLHPDAPKSQRTSLIGDVMTIWSDGMEYDKARLKLAVGGYVDGLQQTLIQAWSMAGQMRDYANKLEARIRDLEQGLDE